MTMPKDELDPAPCSGCGKYYGQHAEGCPSTSPKTNPLTELQRLGQEFDKAERSELTREEFCERFKARMLERAGPTFDDGESIADYADETAPTYFEDYGKMLGPFTKTPEDCADADISYWGED